MKFVIQRVKSAACAVDGSTVSSIDRGLVVFVGITVGDAEQALRIAADKITGLRIFSDDLEKMSLNVNDIGGKILLIPNFTLCGDLRCGYRPDFSEAESFGSAKALFGRFTELVGNLAPVRTGVFGANMLVTAENDGPVTVMLDTEKMKEPRA